MTGNKLLFFDVDGTLIDEKHEMPSSTAEALRRARERGHRVFVNSGRMSSLLRQVSAMAEFDGLLCGCGTELLLGDRQLYYYVMPGELKLKVQEAVERYDIDVILEGKNGCYFRPQPSRFAELERSRVLIAAEQGLGSEPYDGEYEVSKFCFFADEQSRMAQMQQEFSPFFDLIDRGGGFWEAVPLGHDKGRAVQQVLEHLGAQEEDAYVFGDSSNDVGMFRVCRNAIAMGRHDAVLSPLASFVTKTVEEDGIAWALRHFGLID